MKQIVQKTAFAVILLISVPAGIAAALLAFFNAAHVSSSLVALSLAGVLGVLLVTGGLSTWASRGVFRSGRRARCWAPVGVTFGTLTLIFLAAASLVFTPMDVEYVGMDGAVEVHYWELPTGSTIAHIETGVENPSEQAPVVMLHGGPGAPDALERGSADEQLAAAGFHVYRYHQVGAGLSNRLPDVSQYTVARQVEDLEAIRQEIGAERLNLVGGSWGGQLAAYYLAAHPKRVERVVFSSPGALWRPGLPGLGTGPVPESDGSEIDIIAEAATPRFGVVWWLIQINPRAASRLASDEEMSGFLRPLIGQIIAGDVAPCVVKGADDPARGTQDAKAGENSEPRQIIPAGFGFYANTVTSADMETVPDPRPALRELSTPALVIRGECDRMSEEVHREYADVLPRGRLVTLEGVAHNVSGSPIYADLLEAFFRGTELPL